MVQVELNGLAKYKLVETNGMDIQDTPAGRLMARYYVAFQTMKSFMQVEGEETLSDLLVVLSRAAEFQDVQLRNDEKAALNKLNSRKDCAPGLRFPIKGRIKDRECKVNCLLQSLLGGLHIAEPGLQQEAGRVIRTAERLARCLCEVVQLSGRYVALLSAVLLHKCVRCQLWETSALAARQLPRIGPVLAGLLVAAGKTSLAAVAQSNPRDLERIVLRLPPFGNELRDAAAAVPQLVLTLERNRDGGEDVVVLQADIANLDAALNDPRHWVLVLAGDSDNNVIVYDRFPISKLFRGTYFTKIDLSTVSATTVKAHLISESWVGIDCEKSLTINEDSPPPFQEPAAKSLKKRSTFMDKIMKEAASRTSDTPSCRLTASETGGLTLSQRFERFKKTPNLRRLSSLAMDDDLDDPDDPPPGPSAPRATPAAGGVDEVIVIEDDDHDNNWDMPDVQVVPGSSVAASMEYSAIPHQPTIRNFFKPTSGLGSQKSAPPVCVDLEDSCEQPTPALSAWVHLEDSYSNLSQLAGKPAWVQKSAPARSVDHEGAWGPPTPAPSATSCVDLMDDSWDEDILQVTRAAETNVTTQRIVRWRPPTPPPGYVEMRPGCWDFNFDIGIDDLLDDLLQDDEHTADAKPEKFEVKEEPETLDFNEWCAQEDRNILGPETELLASDLVKGTGTLKTFELEHLGPDKWSDGNVIVDKKMESTPVQSSWPGANFTQSDKLPDSYLGYDKWPDADVEHTGNWSDEDLWTGHKLPDTDVKPSANWPQQIGTCPDQVSEHGDKLAGVKIEATEKLSDTNFEQGDKLPDTNVGYSDKLPDSNLDRDKLPGVNIGHIAKLPNSNLERDKCYNVNVEHADDRFDVDFGQGTKLPDANTGRTDELREANLRLDEYLPVTAGELLTSKPGDCGRDRLPFVEGEQVKEAAAPLETGPPREAPATEFETPRMDTNAMDQSVDLFSSPSDAAAAAPPVAEGAQTNADHSCAQQEALQGGVTSVANAAGDAIQRPDLHVEERERGDTSEPAAGGELPVLATVVSVPDRVSEAVTATSPARGGSPASPQRDTTDDGEPGGSNELQIPLLASANIQDRGTSPKSKQPEEVVREATFQEPNRPPCASLLERKCITFADELVGTEEIVDPEDPRKGESRPGQSIAQLGKTFQSVLAANKPNPGTCNLLKFRPQNEGAHNVDDVLARLLADWSNGKPSGKPSARPASSVPPAPRAAPGLLQGALSGAPARRTSAGIVSVPAKAPQEEVAKVDCVERILQEGVPTRLLGKSVVKTINTDRLRAAGVIRGSGTVLSKRLASGLSAALAVVTQEAKEAPGRTATSDPPRAAPLTGEACVRGSPCAPHEAPAKLADTNALPPGDPPCAPPSAPPAPLGAAPPSSRASGSAASVKSGSTRAPSLLSSFIKIPSRGEQVAAEPAAPGPAAKLDWFERLLAEPIGGPLRQPRAATSKRKAQGVQDPGPREPKRPAKGPSSAAVSPWPHRLTLPPKDIYASRPIAKQYGGFSDSISVTATRSRNPPPQPPSPPARRAQLHDESPTYLDDEDAAGPSWRRGHSSATSGRTGQHNSPLFADNALGTFASPFDSELSLGVPFSSRRGEHGGGRNRGEGVVSAMQVQAMLQDDEAVLFDRSRQRSPRYREGDDDAWHRAGARELPLPTGSPSRPWEDLDDDVNLWGDYPTSGSPVRPSEGLFGRRHYDDNDDEEPMLSPSNCSFAPSIRSVQSHSPSYSPAPQRQPSFKWRPSLSAGRGGEGVEYEYEAVDRDDDPYAYVPESSRAGVDVDSFGSPPRFSSPSAGPRQVVPPTPATSGRLVLSLSPPPPRRQPAPAYSKWTSYLD
ncbi:uncharacterized protein LOC113208417 isoform X2 [Frankliniella occidentalis]|uniref:Uncharacterized protein LOC113208417 isoform X2 n=1 Tax=Frankliniella occidentalis TaxID=133901 RepID=A0A9C6XCW8_FRAOC|nr:uncharacterized protein LOC113208417 isoform X2 [Frankliniella occidentalis]